MRKTGIVLGVCVVLVGAVVVWQMEQRRAPGPTRIPGANNPVLETPAPSPEAAASKAADAGRTRPAGADGATSRSTRETALSPAASHAQAVVTSATQVASADHATTGTLRVDAATSGSLSGVPAEFADFHKWPESKRVKTVTEMMRNPDLADDVKTFFRQSLHDKNLSPLVRNNMANALNAQDPKDPALYKEFLTVLDDKSDNPVWRAYAIQFLGETFSYSADRGTVESKLLSVLEGDGNHLEGQAMVTLGYMEREHGARLGKRFDDRLVKALTNPDTPETIRATALGVLGQRGDKKHVDLVRQCVTKSSPSQRVAVATLGLIGDKSDVARVEPLLKSTDPLVRNAATAALKRLREGRK
jgi:hypothetical protein